MRWGVSEPQLPYLSSGVDGASRLPESGKSRAERRSQGCPRGELEERGPSSSFGDCWKHGGRQGFSQAPGARDPLTPGGAGKLHRGAGHGARDLSTLSTGCDPGLVPRLEAAFLPSSLGAQGWYQDFTQETALMGQETQTQGQAGNREDWVTQVGSCGQTVRVLDKKASRALRGLFLLELGA